ncbi:hypothetical protein [Gemmatimonas sp.]|jgi:hypothetical protein|uniref:hypothetical protein n=1 Tax=Gemmatimonas sp. TaxID=1962908 RepID=UPI00334137AD
MSYPQVDRSDLVPNFDGRAGDDVVDVGWAEGQLTEGRPYRLECWSLAGTTGVTVLMADEGLEASGLLEVNALLEASGVITNLAPQELTLHRFVDPSGTSCLSVSYVTANEDDEFFAEAHPPLKPYNRAS